MTSLPLAMMPLNIFPRKSNASLQAVKGYLAFEISKWGQVIIVLSGTCIYVYNSEGSGAEFVRCL